MEGSTTWLFAVLAACLLMGVLSHHHPCHDGDDDDDDFDPHCEDVDVPSINDHLPPVPGVPIEMDQAYFMTSVHNDGKYLCGGVILNEHWVLAADIDLRNIIENATYVFVRTGHSHRDHDGVVYNVAKILVRGRLALLKTVEAINLIPNNTGTIDVATPDHPYIANETAQVIGWGHPGREDRVGGKHTHLHALNVTVLSDEECSAIFGPSYNSTDLICATGHDGCTGSSPLIQKRVIGFVADAVGCGEADMPMTYIDVIPQSDWILEEIET